MSKKACDFGKKTKINFLNTLFKMKHLVYLRNVMGALLVVTLGIVCSVPQNQPGTQTLAVVKTFMGVVGGEGSFL